MNSTVTQYPNQNFGMYRAGARVGGIMVAFQCIVFLIFLSFGFLLMGTIMTATTYRTPSPPFDTEFFRRGEENNPLRIIGPVFLSVGGGLIIFSIILCCAAYSNGKKLQSQNPGGYVQQPIIAGAPSGNMHGSHYHQPQQQSQNPGSYVQQPIIAGAPSGNMYGSHYHQPQQQSPYIPQQPLPQVPYPFQNPQQTVHPTPAESYSIHPAQCCPPQPAYNPESQNSAPPSYHDITKADTPLPNAPDIKY